MIRLQALISKHDDWLTSRILFYARMNHYLEYTSATVEDWRKSIAGLSSALILALKIYNKVLPDIRPLDKYASNPITSFGVDQARKHRRRGVTLGMFLGLLKHYRQSYIDLLDTFDTGSSSDYDYSLFIQRFFDIMEVAVCREWTRVEGDENFKELQVANGRLINEKNKYLSVCESMTSPIILLDQNNNISFLNAAARELLNECLPGDRCCGGRTYNENPLYQLIRHLAGLNVKNGMEICLEREINSSGGTLYFEVKFKKLFDAGNEFYGGVVILNNITTRRQRENTLDEMAQGITPAMGDALWGSMVYHLARALAVDYAYLGELVDGKIVRTVTVYAKGMKHHNFDYSLEGTPCKNVVEKKICFYADEVQRHYTGHPFILEYGVSTYLGAPLYDSRGMVSGLLVVMSQRLLFDSQLAESVIKIFAAHASVELERKRSEGQLKYLSLHDDLTGLYNKRYFEEKMKKLEEGCHAKAGIVICDVDGLKLVNDTLGHETGDMMLTATSDLLVKSFRKEDVVARTDGDEFAVLIPGGDASSVAGACRRLRQNLAQYNESCPKPPLSISVGYAAGSLESTNIADLYKEADNNMCLEKLCHSQSARSAIVHTLMKVLEARDFITGGHADRLQELVLSLAISIGLSERSKNDLRLLAQFHDIGKVGIPDMILFKKGPLTPDEFRQMQKHCEIGYGIANSVPDLSPVADWILKHHEWWNGNGYPLGLKGEEIPLECRLLAIADAYDAMTNHRPYRRAISRNEAFRELTNCAGTQFDPVLVSVFVQAVDMSEVFDDKVSMGNVS